MIENEDINITNKKCFSELDEILKYLSEDDLAKIPKNIIKYIQENKEKSYVWKYDESKKIYEQKISKKTVAILAYLNMEYLCTDEQKRYLQKLHENNGK